MCTSVSSVSTAVKLHDPWVCTTITLWVRLVKILISLEPYGIFGSNFAYLFILILSSHWYATRWLSFADFLFAKPCRRFAYLSLRSLVNVLHTGISITLKCVRTKVCMETISERLFVHLDRNVETLSLATRTLFFPLKYLELHSN